MEQLISEPYITPGQVRLWQAFEFLYHLRWALAGDGFYQKFIDKIIITTGYKVYFPSFSANWTQLIPNFNNEEPEDLSIPTID